MAFIVYSVYFSHECFYFYASEARWMTTWEGSSQWCHQNHEILSPVRFNCPPLLLSIITLLVSEPFLFCLASPHVSSFLLMCLCFCLTIVCMLYGPKLVFVFPTNATLSCYRWREKERMLCSIEVITEKSLALGSQFGILNYDTPCLALLADLRKHRS